MRQFISLVLCVLVLSTGGCPKEPSHRPAEDDPGWNCQTQGNHTCGPADEGRQ